MHALEVFQATFQVVEWFAQPPSLLPRWPCCLVCRLFLQRALKPIFWSIASWLTSCWFISCCFSHDYVDEFSVGSSSTHFDVSLGIIESAPPWCNYDDPRCGLGCHKLCRPGTVLAPSHHTSGHFHHCPANALAGTYSRTLWLRCQLRQ